MELYQYCEEIKNLKPVIFWRYLIPDFGYQDTHNFRALIDNILNYNKSTPILTPILTPIKLQTQTLEYQSGGTATPKETVKETKNILIHCLGGHGRTGSVACCLVAVKFFLLNETIKKLLTDFENKYFIIQKQEKQNESKEQEKQNESKDKFKYFRNYRNIDIYIRNIANIIFKLSQLYVMGSLRIHRETDRKETRPDPHAMLVPETPAQNEMVKNVIEDYIHDFLNNETFGEPKKPVTECKKTEMINYMGNNEWLCAGNIDPKIITEKKDHENIIEFKKKYK
jgi:hypothetical protein